MAQRNPHSERAKGGVSGGWRDPQQRGCVDEWMQDQLIIFMALSHGVSRMRTGPLSMHTQTAMHYAAFITGATFTETKAEGGTNIVECHGIGFDGVDAQV
mmetsp:Transcript_32112/g.69365  ORF Transcript_32112/g.69365 Transcript_32112/m.69365 type:complete len:100 (+) Transcript_32112:868-1167(+)